MNIQKDGNILTILEQHRVNIPNKAALCMPNAKEILNSFDNLEEVANSATEEFPLHSIVTYNDLAQSCESVAANLADLGIGFGDRVFIFIPISPMLYIAMFAVQRLGAIAVFLDAWNREEQLRLCAKQVEPIAVIAPQQAYQLLDRVPQLRNVCHRICVYDNGDKFGASLQQMMNTIKKCSIYGVTQDDSALITFTTGSTGNPKGADRTHGFLMAQHRSLQKNLPYDSAERDLPAFPVFALNNLGCGITTIIPAVNLAKPADHDGELLLAQIILCKVNCCTFSPYLLHSLSSAAANFPHHKITTLRRVMAGGAAISHDAVMAFKKIAPKCQLDIMYGSTEVEPISHFHTNAYPKLALEGVCVGNLCHGLEMKLIIPTPHIIEFSINGWQELEVAKGSVGEVIVSGEHVCQRYYKNSKAFKATKIIDKDGKLWHRTGDVAHLDDEDRIWLVGRIHNTIHRAGKSLFPVRPESLLRQLPFVEHAAYLGVANDKLGESAYVLYTLKENLPAIDYHKLICKMLDDEKIIYDMVKQVDDIPLDPRHNSKVQYHLLRKQLGDSDLA